MPPTIRSPHRPARRAAASVELALLLPFLLFAFVAAVDFARIFYYTLTITNCARCGALYGSQGPDYATQTANIKAAALADASSVTPTPTADDPVLGHDPPGDPYIQSPVP